MAIVEQMHIDWPTWVWVETHRGVKYTDRTGVERRVGGIQNIIDTAQDGILKRYGPIPTERHALLNLADEAFYWRQTGGRVELSRLHVQVVQIERAVRQHFPHIKGDELLRWIASNANLFRRRGRRKEVDTWFAFQIMEHASWIMMLREHLGLDTELADLPSRELKRLPMAA